MAYKTKRDGASRPKSSLTKERSCLSIYILRFSATRGSATSIFPTSTRPCATSPCKNGSPASGGAKSTVAAVLRRLFALGAGTAHYSSKPALELRTGWGGSVRRRVLIPSVPQVLRLAEALDHLKLLAWRIR